MISEFGFVYILSNACMPGIYKIGRTDRAPSQRALELSSGTGIPMPFDVIFYAEVQGSVDAEADLHKAFARNRVSQNREFFQLDDEELLRAAELAMEWSTGSNLADDFRRKFQAWRQAAWDRMIAENAAMTSAGSA